MPEVSEDLEILIIHCSISPSVILPAHAYWVHDFSSDNGTSIKLGLSCKYVQHIKITHVLDTCKPGGWYQSKCRTYRISGNFREYQISWFCGQKEYLYFPEYNFSRILEYTRFLIPKISLFKGVKAEDKVVPAYLQFRYRSIYLYILVPMQVNQLFMKKNLQASKSFYISYI